MPTKAIVVNRIERESPRDGAEKFNEINSMSI